MVDLDPLNEDDFVTIKDQLNKHINLTSSPLGVEFLENWDENRNRFIKVIPRDYKEVLRKKALEQTTTLV
jgi:glutamate synthase (NADPH/NADH) large chain